MTEVRTFRAPNMQSALDLVRAEMGGEAVILHTRQVPIRRLLPWSKPKEEVEITAGLDVPIRSPVDRSRQRSVVTDESNARPPVYAMPTATKSSTAIPTKSITKNRPSGIRSESPRLELPATSPTTPGGLGHSTEKPNSPPYPSAPAQALRGGPSAPKSLNDAVPSIKASPEKTVRSTPSKSGLPPITQSRPAPLPKAVPSDDPNVLFSNKLDTLQKMIEDLARTSHKRASAEIPAEMFHLYTQLIDAEVEDELARDLIFRLPRHDRSAPSDMHAAQSLLTAMVSSEIHCGSVIAPDRNRRKVVALVGPTGVGKTTTIAKLAANFRLRDNIRMGLVTVDTYRIAAVEQLRTYAEIIDLPMKVVTSPSEMRRALDELSGLELVLIDTGGRSPRDEMKIQELKNLLSEAEVDEVHLVLGLNASLRSLDSTVEMFRQVNVSSLLLSKLDEAPSLGTILSLSRKFPWPISYVTTGQDVPDDIEPAHPDRLARLILGQDRLTP
ncbi:MAG: flagellar biosynthesis protein FlhF [Planctomycetota bacterium]|nr:flagellar biosynthesis protein FlhF [Planctomycetota bacterium]MDA1211036.1 flagellar biosynthesis protein FlhF [Planctomycetota bacterium]